MATLIRLTAGMDPNGNSRVVYARVDWGRMRVKGPHAWIDDGRGTAVVPERLRQAASSAPTIKVTYQEWHSWTGGAA